MSNYFARLAARLAPAGGESQRGKAPAFSSATQAAPAFETPLARSPSIATSPRATNPSSGPTGAPAALPGVDTAAAGDAPRSAGVAPDTSAPVPAARPGRQEAPEPMPQVGHPAPLTSLTTAPPPAPNPAPQFGKPAVEAAVAVAPEPAKTARLPDADATSDTGLRGARQSQAQPGPPEPRAGRAVEHDTSTERQAPSRQKEPSASSSVPAQPAKPATPIAARHSHSAIRPAATPRRQREPAAPRIDVHIGVITLAVRAPAPAPASVPQAAPRAEARPAFSASRHYLRCP